MQCNQECADQEHLKLHVFNQHTFPARRGTRNYPKALLKVLQCFQPKVTLCNGLSMSNKHTPTWVGMTFTANGDEVVHVEDHILQVKIAFVNIAVSCAVHSSGGAQKFHCTRVWRCHAPPLVVRLCTLRLVYAGSIACSM